MISYHLKQSFIEYFNLNQIDNNANIEQVIAFLAKQIKNADNPQQKALHIWDNFVTTNDDLFDFFTSKDVKTRLSELRDMILHNFSVDNAICAFRCVGISPFCYHRVVGQQ